MFAGTPARPYFVSPEGGDGRHSIPRSDVDALSLDSNRLKVSILTRREREIATLVARGLSNAQIAKRLSIQERTVKNRLTVIFHKVGVRNRVQLTLWLRERIGR